MKLFNLFEIKRRLCFGALQLALTSVLCVTIQSQGQSIYLIEAQPKTPNPAVIYRLDSLINRLDTMASIMPVPRGVNSIWSIEIYNGGDPVIISEGDWFPVKLHIIRHADMDDIQQIDIAPYSTVRNYWYYEYPDHTGFLKMEFSKSHIAPQENLIFQLQGKSIRKVSQTFDAPSELRLAGVQPQYGTCGKNDIITVRKNSNGDFEALELSGSIFNPAVPDSIVKMKGSTGWIVVANEPNYRAMLSIPDRNGLSERELLIYRTDGDYWKSFILMGAETALHLVNGWLTGVVADSDPNSDYTQHKGYPSVLRGIIVMVNPIENIQFAVQLGNGCEILWIEDGTVYYRVGQELYKARIDNDNIVDQTLILTDPRIDNIHWAFRGSMATESK
jgi:hypothetical protein